MRRLKLRFMAKEPGKTEVVEIFRPKDEFHIPKTNEISKIREITSFPSGIKREPFEIQTDPSSESEDEPNVENENLPYEQMIGSTIEEEIAKISNSTLSDVEDKTILNDELLCDSPNERIIDDARILAENNLTRVKIYCQYCHRELIAKKVKNHERMCGQKPKIPKIKQEPKELEKVNCRICNEEFNNITTLRQHMKLVHIEMVNTGHIGFSSDKGRSLRKRNDSGNSATNSLSDENVSPSSKRTRKLNPKFFTSPANQKPVKTSMKTPEITVEKTPQKTSHSESTPTRQNKPNKEPLHCQMCGEKFYKKTDLDNHYKHMHKDYKPFQCPLCFSFYRTKTHMKTHIMSVHGFSEVEFKEMFPDLPRGKQGYDAFVQAQQSIDLTVCDPITPSMPSRKIGQIQEFRRRTPGRPSKKNQARFEDLFVLKRRFSLESDTPESEIFSCAVCSKEFEDQNEFTKHVQKKHRAKFRRSVDATQMHDIKERRKTCPLTRTDSIGGTAESGNSEDSSDSPQSSFPCEYCGRSFISKANRIVHERLHTGEKPFQCSVCFKSFACFTYLTSHLELAHNLLKG